MLIGRTRILGLVAALATLALAGPAFAQFKPWPNPIPPEPRWGDYNRAHRWQEAAMWALKTDWIREHHPEWWGDFDDDGVWRPAWWWWESNPGWVRAHHPEWWG